MRVRILLVAALMVPVLFACGAPEGKRPETVLAEVNGKPITSTEFEREASVLPPYMRPILETRNGRLQFLESLITRDLLMQEAMRRGIDRKPEVLRRLAQARRTIVLETLLREVAEQMPEIPDAKIRKRYEEHPDGYKAGERVWIRQLHFQDLAHAEAAARLVKHGEPFDALMKEAERLGGKASDMGFIERGETDKEFETAAFSSPPGSVVGPVHTTYGYQLLEVVDKRPAGRMPFEEARERIEEELRDAAQREAFDRLVDGLRKSSRVKLYPPYAGTAAPEGLPGSEPDNVSSPPGR